MSLVLRDYQQEAISAIWNEFFIAQVALCSLPTASGKTEVFIGLLQKAIEKKPDIKAVILVNKITLLEQTERRIAAVFGKESTGIFCGSKSSYVLNKTITVASIQSIFDVQMELLHLIIIDECHNLSEKSDSRYFNFINKQKQLNPRLKIVGFTATAFRSNAGYIFGPDKFFQKLTYIKTMKELIDEGYLCPYTLKHCENQFKTDGLKIENGDYKMSELVALTVDQDKIVKQLMDAIPRLVGRKKIVWACTCIEHAELLHKLLSEIEESSIIHSKLSKEERFENLRSFENDEKRHLVFVSIVSEGYDYPKIDCVVFMRPTRSPVLFLQTIGRGLRLFENKENCLVLDYGQVIQNQGLPEDVFVRQGLNKKEKESSVVGPKFCPKCLEYLPKNSQNCTKCEYVFDSKLDLNEKIKSLTIKAYSEKPSDWRIVRYIQFSKTVSKAGNPCITLTYFFKFELTSFREIFSLNHTFPRQKLIKRLYDLKATDPNNFDINVLNKELEDSVEAIQTMQEASYDTVAAVKIRELHDRKRDRTSDPALPKPTTHDVRDQNKHDRDL